MAVAADGGGVGGYVAVQMGVGIVAQAGGVEALVPICAEAVVATAECGPGQSVGGVKGIRVLIADAVEAEFLSQLAGAVGREGQGVAQHRVASAAPGQRSGPVWSS